MSKDNPNDPTSLLRQFEALTKISITSGGKPSSELFKEVTDKIQDELKAKKAAKLEEMIRKAMTMANTREEARKAFEKSDKTFAKEFNNILKQIHAYADGKSPEESEDSEEETK